MEKTSGANSQSVGEIREKLRLAKLLLFKYGTLHEILTYQMTCYTVTCCPIAIYGTVEVDADNRMVTYNVKSSFLFYRDENSFKPLSSVRTKANLFLKGKEYQENIEMAKINLNTWNKEILWPDTTVKLIFDGQSV